MREDLNFDMIVRNKYACICNSCDIYGMHNLIKPLHATIKRAYIL